MRGFGARLLLFGGLGNPKPAPTGGIWLLIRLFEARFVLAAFHWSLDLHHATAEGHKNRIRHFWTRRGAWGDTQLVQEQRNPVWSANKAELDPPNGAQLQFRSFDAGFRVTELSSHADPSDFPRDQATSHPFLIGR